MTDRDAFQDNFGDLRAVHFEDQLRTDKKCDHLEEKVVCRVLRRWDYIPSAVKTLRRAGGYQPSTRTRPGG